MSVATCRAQLNLSFSRERLIADYVKLEPELNTFIAYGAGNGMAEGNMFGWVAK